MVNIESSKYREIKNSNVSNQNPNPDSVLGGLVLLAFSILMLYLVLTW